MIARAKKTPDIWQHMPKIEKYSRSHMHLMSKQEKKEKEFNSDSFCGPTAVSNGIIYWTKNGYPDLNPMNSQVEMVKVLGSEEYMNAFNGGTNLYNLCKAVNMYLKENGSKLKKAYIRHIGKPSYSNSLEKASYVDVKYYQKSIDPNFYKKNLINPKSLQILLWGKYKMEKGGLVRVGGHYVTVVGYGLDEKDKPNKNMLIIHNPSTSPKKPKRQFLDLKPLAGYDGIKRGTVLKALRSDGTTRWATKAEGKILVGTGKTTYRVLDGIIDFRIE